MTTRVPFSQAFPVLTETVPFIIGKKGAKIDAIEKATGAALSIGEGGGPNTFGREWSYIHILGEGYQVGHCSFSGQV